MKPCANGFGNWRTNGVGSAIVVWASCWPEKVLKVSVASNPAWHAYLLVLREPILALRAKMERRYSFSFCPEAT